jgi:hypothetical protein
MTSHLAGSNPKPGPSPGFFSPVRRTGKRTHVQAAFFALKFDGYVYRV